MEKIKRRMYALGVICLLALSIAGCGRAEGEGTQQSKGQMEFLKSFEAKTTDGASFTQEDLAERDVTVFYFWGLTCGPCISEMPDLAAYEKSLPEHVGLVTVCLDGAGDVEGTKSVLQEAGYGGVTLVGGDDNFQKLCSVIMYTPTALVIDKEGNIMGDAIVGGQKNLEKTYTDAVNQALKSMGKDGI